MQLLNTITIMKPFTPKFKWCLFLLQPKVPAHTKLGHFIQINVLVYVQNDLI